MYTQYIIVVALANFIQLLYANEGALYLQNTIQGLRKHVDYGTNRRIMPHVVTPAPIDRALTQENVPPIQLTKAELASYYQNAIHKGETIKLDPGDHSAHPISAAVHKIDDSDHNDKDKDGYYYYYYPLKSFIDEISSDDEHHHHQDSKKTSTKEWEKYHTYHSHDDPKHHIFAHTHEHNVHIEPVKNVMDTDKKNKLEPLFMAISGFIGMTIMFILSALILPKFDKMKPKGFKEPSPEITTMTRVALQAIEGKDCNERLVCEVGKVAKAFHLYDNRFVKLVRRYAPNSFGKQIDKIGKYTDKKYKCASIQCKRKEPPSAKLKTIPRKPKIINLL